MSIMKYTSDINIIIFNNFTVSMAIMPQRHVGVGGVTGSEIEREDFSKKKGR